MSAYYKEILKEKEIHWENTDDTKSWSNKVYFVLQNLSYNVEIRKNLERFIVDEIDLDDENLVSNLFRTKNFGFEQCQIYLYQIP